MPRVSHARCRAVVQFATAQACLAPTYSANSLSNAATSGPWVTQPERIGRPAAWASSAPRHGLAIGIRKSSLLDITHTFGTLPVMDYFVLEQSLGLCVKAVIPI